MRGLAIAIIASSHILYYSEETHFFKVTSAIYLNSTIFFAIISGYLFHHLLPKFEYKKYIKKKFLYVLLPYLVVSIPALAFRFYTGPPFLILQNYSEFQTKTEVFKVIYYLVTGAHLLPLWYLPMIAIFFVLAPLFKFIADHQKLYWILIPAFTLSLLLPRGIDTLNNIPYMFGHFLSIYLLGMFISQFEEKILQFVRKNLIIVITGFLGLFMLSVLTTEFRAQVIFIQKLFATLLILYGFQFLRNKMVCKVLDTLADTSFGIYFIHFYIILIIRKLSQKFYGFEYPEHPGIWCMELLIVMFISVSAVLVIKFTIGKYSRYIIGS